ncbi:P-loop containing nucleoside triphosphate hydrolase protein [Chaetomium strumarium]|uniref:P-loop containing nucleoside triphosphate hydrolase protein n=1 Tax=Chaetomium strumarium TaxID=1170767 RepID=A0AAJ0M5Q4_9PEZI|nr:P-loop containing nucleoside triphosphate hydrolase protein [Chaetomium strumarium]
MVTRLDLALDAQELAGEQRALLDLLDKLQFAQLDNVKLPQIVVVGDQSAGKSSVLEAITGTPFPRDAGACTRFATEIRLRRAPQTSINVSVIPDKNRSFAEQERLRQFGGTVNADIPFEHLMRSAVDLIAPKNIPGRFAARDILVVEKRGPEMPLLTLVDLPGLVRNANNDQSLEDIRTIEALSDRYMKSSRTIILAVVGGNADYVQAPILTKARHFDPTGSRTIGVLTKPDLTESIGLEDKFINLVTNKDKQNDFRLGWYVLLNPAPREPGQPWPTAEERRRAEAAFFSNGKWSSIPPSMWGVRALMQKLSVQLQQHIGKHIHVLRKQIQKALDDCEAELKSLGNAKDTPEEMRIELVELFSGSKELVIPAVYGFYKNPPKKNFFRVTADPRGTPAQNLRARATEENDRFAMRIRAHGRKFNFSVPPPQGAGAQAPEAGIKREFITQEVESLLRQVRGSEFPMDPKPRAVYMLFQSYSENWPRLAQEHKDNLGVVCNEFLGELIDYAWPKRMREPLRRHFLEPHLKELMEKAQHELDLLTEDLNLEVQPYDPEYEERLRSWQARVSKDGATFSEAEEILEKMLIYYDLAAKTFIRNIITQVVERHLLQGMYGLFNSAEVLGLSNEIVDAIAAENKETRDRRQTLRVQKKAIQEAKELCASLAMRKELRAYAENGADEAEDTSDDDESKVVRTTPSPRASHSPSASRPSRRSRRPVGDTESLQTYPGRSAEPASAPEQRHSQLPLPATLPTPSNGYAPPHNGYGPPSSATQGSGGVVDGSSYTTTTTRPPQQAPPPPPPPRPGKVRDEEEEKLYAQGRPYSPAPPRAATTRVSQGSAPAAVPPETHYTNAYASNSAYVPAEAAEFEVMRRQARKASGRA